jgi:eukaryotic-like serine/threonine-protein kinase
MRADLMRVRSGWPPRAPMVLGDDERAASLRSGTTGDIRRIDARGMLGAPLAPVHRDDEPERRAGRRLVIGVAAAVVVGLVGLMGYLVFGGSPAVRVVAIPDVAGQQPDAARAALQAANLLVSIDRVPSTPDQKDRVVGTDPAANSQVPERSTVKLQVGNGPDQAAVPPLTGRSVAEAGPLLIQRGLVLGAQTEQNTTDPAQIGKILSSSPPAGENVPAGSAVAVVVGKQQTTVAVPNVTGKSSDDAVKAIQQAGLVVRTSEVDAGGDQGDVVATDPPAGTQVAPGSTVTLQVTTGDGNSSVDMPDVTGDKQRDAQRKLEQKGLVVSVQTRSTNDKSDDGRVLDQSPSSGSRVSPGDPVTLLVGAYGGSSGTPDASTSPTN